MSIDIPTALTDAETAELQRLAAGKDVLEVGSLLGYSTVCLAQVAAHVHSVDPHVGYPVENPRPTLGPFMANLERYGVREKVTVHVGFDADVLPSLRHHQFDLAFLDMTGLYEDTLRGIRLTVPLLRHWAALCVHDCGHPEWPGALAAVEDFATAIGTTFRLIDRLGIFEQTWGNVQEEVGDDRERAA